MGLKEAGGAFPDRRRERSRAIMIPLDYGIRSVAAAAGY